MTNLQKTRLRRSLSKVGLLSICSEDPKGLRKAKILDSCWLVSYPIIKEISAHEPWRDINSPNWSGYMQTSVISGNYHVSDLQTVPFIKLDPNKPETTFSALSFAQRQMQKLFPSNEAGKKFQAAVTFDQNLHEPADDIWLANRKKLDQIFLRLGGFRTLMCLTGAGGSSWKAVD